MAAGGRLLGSFLWSLMIEEQVLYFLSFLFKDFGKLLRQLVLGFGDRGFGLSFMEIRVSRRLAQHYAGGRFRRIFILMEK